jgi:hypothetical protein
LNNGITVICDSANPGQSGGIDFLEVFNPQIINGQQTTYALHEAGKQARKSKVFVRVIEVSKRNKKHWSDKEAMVASIVEATNSQNAIKAADLRSNDRTQVRLQRDLRKLGYFYVRKAGKAAEWDLAVQSHPRVKKEDVARAAMACEDSATLLNEGAQYLFEDEIYKDLFRLKPKQFLCRWWLMKAVGAEARGSGERQAGKFLVIEFVWEKLGAQIETHEDSFIQGCERGDLDRRKRELDRAIVHAMNAAIQHYRLDRRSGGEVLEANPFFKRRDRYAQFRSFWRSKRVSHKKNFSKAARDFKTALRAGA